MSTFRACSNHAQNNAIVSHSYSKDHQIYWNQSKIIFKNSDAHVRRLIVGAAMNLGNSFKGNKSFVNEDPYVKFYLFNNFVNNFDFKLSSVFPTFALFTGMPRHGKLERQQTSTKN